MHFSQILLELNGNILTRTDRIIRAIILEAVEEVRTLVLIIHVDGRLVWGEERWGPVQVFIEVVLSLTGGLQLQTTCRVI